MRSNLHTILVAAVLLVALHAIAQETPDMQRGMQPYASMMGGDLDTVNLVNGNLTLHIPILSYPQRGKSLHLNYDIYYNDKQYFFNYTVDSYMHENGQWNPYNVNGNDNSNHVGSYVAPDQWVTSQTMTTYVVGACVLNPPQSPCSNPLSNYYVAGPDDSRHYYGNYANANGGHSANLGMAIDNSGYVVGNSGAVVDRDGISYANGKATDVDGNYITYGSSPGITYGYTSTAVTDTMGRVIPVPTSIAVGSTPCSSGTIAATVWNIPGSSNPYYYCYKTLTFLTAFNAARTPMICNIIGAAEASGTQTMLTEVILPKQDSNGNWIRYQFTYDSYLSLTKLTLPTGGYISYTWQNENFNCGSAPITRALASRTKFDGTTSTTWHYQWIPNGTGSWKHIVTDPLGNDEVHYVGMTVGIDSEVDAYQGCSPGNAQYCVAGSGTPLKKVVNAYQTTNDVSIFNLNQVTMFAAPILASRTVILAGPNNRQSKTTYTLAPALYTRTFYVWPADPSQSPTTNSVSFLSGQVATVTDYDYGSGAPSSTPLRSATTTFKWQDTTNGSSYLNANLIDLPLSVVISDGSGNKCAETDYAFDESAYPVQSSGVTMQHTSAPNGSILGNTTTVTKQLSATPCQSGATWTGVAVQHAKDYDTGEDYQDIDARGLTTTHSYSSTYYGAYRTQTQMPDTGSVHHIVSGAYDFNTGLITSFVGQNGAPETTNYVWDYNLRRIQSATFPDAGQTSFTYNDTPGSLQVQMTQAQTSSTSITKTAQFDNLGRTVHSTLLDPEGNDISDTTYDADGRVATVSNPHRSASSSTDGVTSTQYDGAGRAIVITKQDGSTVQTSYITDACTANTNASATVVTDEAGKTRRTCSDALGRLVEVDEPAPTLSTPLVTLYTYDALGNLTCVVQKATDTTAFTTCGAASATWRPRSFTYDSFSRLLTANNPETGTVTYTYDSDAGCASPNSYTMLLVSKKDARNLRTCLQYDNLNRVVAKTFPNGDPTITYTFDGGTNGIGRRSGMTDASGSSSWVFDVMGQVTTESLTIGSVNKSFVSAYNLDGSIKQVTYPTGSGSVIAYSYNTAGHLTQVQDTAHSITYLSGTSYAPPGEIALATYGGVKETGIYNNRLQPCWYYATTGTQLPSSTGCTGTASAANVMDLKYNYAWGTTDDGEVMSTTNNKDSNRSVTYTYDALNRIASASSGGTDCSLVPGTSITKNWGETMTIDAWGNLTNRTVTKCSADPLSVTALTNNRLSGFGYDNAGNMTSNGGATYTYNSESQLATAVGVTYTYDGDGLRVKKSSGTLYWGAGPMLESDASGNFQREFIIAGGRRIARRDISSGNAYYFLSDRLGSSAVITNSAGTIQNEYDYLPYGGERDYSTSLANQNYKFIGKERDSESGLDNFGARFDSSNLGRFMTPDWAARPTTVPYAVFGDPQSLNLYGYVRNDPVTNADLDGHDPGSALSFAELGAQFENDMHWGPPTCTSGRPKEFTEEQRQAASPDAHGAVAAGVVSAGSSARSCGFWCRLGHRVSGTASGKTAAIKTYDPATGTIVSESRTGEHPFRDNNPGDIKTEGGFADRHGAVGDDKGIAIFPSGQAGFKALAGLLSTPRYQSLTLDQAIAVYAPPNENDTAAYQASAQAQVGVSGGTRLSALSVEQMGRLVEGIAQIEGYYHGGTVSTETISISPEERAIFH